MMLHPNTINSAMGDPGRTRHSKRKAAAETPEGNERLSKRLSLLKLDNAGARAYRAVGGSQEHQPQSIPTAVYEQYEQYERPYGRPYEQLYTPQHNAATPVDPIITDAPGTNALPLQPLATAPRERKAAPPSAAAAAADDDDDDSMSLDDTRYKVYIHNIDSELADDEAESSSDNETTYEAVQTDDASGKLVFMPVIKKHLRAAARDAALGASLGAAGASLTQQPRKLAVPRPIIPNKDGELAGMQVVLYREPASLSVAPENDSVRQAILDTRARYRERLRQEEERERLKAELVDVTETGNVSVNGDTSMTSTPTPGTPIASAVDPGSESDVMDLD